jgi:hypothetical protein
VLGLLHRQAPLEHGFDHLRQETTLAGQPQTAGIDPVHHIIEQPGVEHLVDRLTRRGRGTARTAPDPTPAPTADLQSRSSVYSSTQEDLVTQTI